MIGLVLSYIIAALSLYAVAEIILLGKALILRQWSDDGSSTAEPTPGTTSSPEEVVERQKKLPRKGVSIHVVKQGHDIAAAPQNDIAYSEDEFVVTVAGSKLFSDFDYKFYLEDGGWNVLEITHKEE
ncbi:MAG: hypothetical protein ACMXYK_05510, partial [Candidatus Woesearchaeota archaeon]